MTSSGSHWHEFYYLPQKTLAFLLWSCPSISLQIVSLVPSHLWASLLCSEHQAVSRQGFPGLSPSSQKGSKTAFNPKPVLSCELVKKSVCCQFHYREVWKISINLDFLFLQTRKKMITLPLLVHWDSDYEKVKVALNATYLLMTCKWKSAPYSYLPDIPTWVLWQKEWCSPNIPSATPCFPTPLTLDWDLVTSFGQWTVSESAP